MCSEFLQFSVFALRHLDMQSVVKTALLFG